jgi:hypothetical protein
MTSPFPGMDPFIEACHLWEDFHYRLISEIINSLSPFLPSRYVVRAGERTYKSEFREPFLEIREVHRDRQLVTTVEILSPSNKRFGSEGWLEYLRKRQMCLGGIFNFVEIDLLRGGRRMPMDDDWPESPYYLLLMCRKDQVPRCTVWPASFLRPLPPIAIPLLPPDSDITLALQPMIEAIFARSHYELDIDYNQPLRPPLSTEETAWFEERIRRRQTAS